MCNLRLTLVFCLLMSALSAQAQAPREHLLWLVRDLPPFTIFEGPAKGQGVIDQMLPLLIAQMPEYDHSILRVNRARGIQMLQGTALTCDPTLLWTPERDKYAHFSRPSLAVLSGGLVVRKQDQGLLAAYVNGHQVNLRHLMSDARLKLGIVAERSYSAQVDAMLQQFPDSALTRHYGSDATSSLLQMQQLGRLQAVLGYWHEFRYLLQQQGRSAQDYVFYPIEGVDHFQLLRVGCTDTAQGREAVNHIDRLLLQLRRDTLPSLYTQWLDPALRTEYLEQARQLFEDAAVDIPPQP
ncbi:TIGR02285 family protein [Pseudomonas sp. NY15463]|uniref:TIGR02285 family protein n=1 Tax=Pseudomonas sp. NY15463 TaxID=3400361 RepID=UPI003A89BD3B